MERHHIVSCATLSAVAFITYQIYKKLNEAQYDLPGPRPSSKELGNFGDMSAAGSLPEYLLELTKKYGNIGAFWWGDTRVAYIASQRVLLDKENKKILNKLADRPPLLFEAFEPLISEHSIQYKNGSEFEAKYHRVFLKAFQNNMISKVPIIISTTQQIINKWKDKAVIDMSADSFLFASTSIFNIGFGSNNFDESVISEFIAAYKGSWYEMEKRLIDGTPSNAHRDAEFEKNLNKMKEIIRTCMNSQNSITSKDSFINCLSEQSELYDTEEKILADAITAIVGGFHTTGTAISWIFYYISINEGVQQKMFDEIKHFFNVNAPMNEYFDSAQTVLDKLKKLVYCKQVITESLRLSSLAPWAARVNNESDMILNCCDDTKGKVMIPKRMPFIIAYAASLNDEKVFEDAIKFDPDRWSRNNLKKDPLIKQSQNAMFGGLGGRVCPGWTLFRTESLIFVVAAISKFKFELIGDAKVKTKWGLLAAPAATIKLRITKRV